MTISVTIDSADIDELCAHAEISIKQRLEVLNSLSLDERTIVLCGMPGGEIWATYGRPKMFNQILLARIILFKPNSYGLAASELFGPDVKAQIQERLHATIAALGLTRKTKAKPFVNSYN